MESCVKSIQWGKGLVKQIEIYPILGSTNEFAKERIQGGGISGTVIWALQQTKGKGRRGRTWDADHTSLTFSIMCRLWTTTPPKNLALTVGLGLVQTLESLIPEVKVKWPNDLWVGEKKLGGILGETIAVQDQLWVIMGVGINVNASPNPVLSPRISIEEATNCLWPRLGVLHLALLGLERGFDLAEEPQADFPHLFRKYGNFLNRKITVFQGDRSWPATAKEVLADGRLLVEDAQGLRALMPDEISVRF